MDDAHRMQDPVSAIMATRLEMVSDTIPMSYAAKLMFDKHVTGLPVTTELGELIGVISWRDVLHAMNDEGEVSSQGFYDAGYLGGSAPAFDGLKGTVAEHMNKSLVVVKDDASVRDAAEKMAAENVHRVLVVDDRGNLAGLVSAIDIVRHIVEGGG